MTKSEAQKALLEGKKVAHEYYSPDEHILIDKLGVLRDEKGYDMGGFTGEFWTVYQKWETGWLIRD